MDFGILLMAIGWVMGAMFIATVICGWMQFALYNVHNYFMATFIAILPPIVALIIVMYHVIRL